MQQILAKALTYVFVIVVYLFIYAIIRMIFLDIRAMSKKKNLIRAEGYLKLINLRSDLPFDVRESYEITDDNTIGRGRGCSIRIDDESLSGEHCRIFKSDGSFFLEDNDSTNGTFLNGEPVTDEAVELIDGDKISIGSLMFLYVKPDND
ncbi:MAG: FHA domain-containing protein [Clostridia bacterium]|nr:FHA domain-containing protein [Clostridia bacterium]